MKTKTDLPRYHKYNNAFIQTSQLFNFIKQLFAPNSLGGLRVSFKTDISESNTLKGLPNGCFMVSLLCLLLFYSIIIKSKVNWVHIQFCVRLKKKDNPWWRHSVCCLSVQNHYICSHICLGQIQMFRWRKTDLWLMGQACLCLCTIDYQATCLFTGKKRQTFMSGKWRDD